MSKLIRFQDGDFKTSTSCPRCSHCVTIAYKDGLIAVRDTKDAAKNTLYFNKNEWHAFITGVKNGEFDFR